MYQYNIQHYDDDLDPFNKPTTKLNKQLNKLQYMKNQKKKNNRY